MNPKNMFLSLVIAFTTLAGCVLLASSFAWQAGSPGQTSPSDGSLQDSKSDLLDGLRARTLVSVARVLVDPADGAQVVPVAASLDVIYDGVSIVTARALEIQPVASSAPIEWTLGGLTAASAQPALAEKLPPHTYHFKVRPRDQKLWSQVKNETDVVLTWELQ